MLELGEHDQRVDASGRRDGGPLPGEVELAGIRQGGLHEGRDVLLRAGPGSCHQCQDMAKLPFFGLRPGPRLGSES